MRRVEFDGVWVAFDYIWDIRAEIETMSGCNSIPQIVGYAGQVRDVTVRWNEVAILLSESSLSSVVWSRVDGDATVGSGSLGYLTSSCRIVVGSRDSIVQAVATFAGGQTTRQQFVVHPNR